MGVQHQFCRRSGRGRAAIISTIDTADSAQPFDFFGVVEAAGDSPAGNYSAWSQRSAALRRLESVTSRSKYEIMAIAYDAAKWELNYSLAGEFEPGRPYLVAQFLPQAGGVPAACRAAVGPVPPPCTPAVVQRGLAVGCTADEVRTLCAGTAPVWVVAVHLNHYFLTSFHPPHVDAVIPGAVLAKALSDASAATGADIAAGSVIMFGDWNEFEWADFTDPGGFPNCRKDAQARMAPLWDGYFSGRMSDAVSPRTVSCCTKWAAGDRDPYPEWRFEYDHIFHSSDLALAPGSNAPAFLPYDYPGVAAPGCGDAFCTGENPPGNVTARSQGSWHRAVHATFQRSA